MSDKTSERSKPMRKAGKRKLQKPAPVEPIIEHFQLDGTPIPLPNKIVAGRRRPGRKKT